MSVGSTDCLGWVIIDSLFLLALNTDEMGDFDIDLDVLGILSTDLSFVTNSLLDTAP